jgi:HK97 gp10 family phage protein
MPGVGLMAKMKGMTVEGIEPFRRKMKRLPKNVQKRVVKKAITRAGAIVRMHARKLVKKNAIDDGMPNDHLYKQIISKTSMVGGSPVVTVGAEYGKQSVAHFVYLGTKPHSIPVPWLSADIEHPGSRPFPFMEIALSESRGKAQSEMVKRLASEIAKELTKK